MVKHTGTIVDESGQPLWGAHIITMNSTPRRFATSNENGRFSISGNIGELFEITFIGFKPQTFVLQNNMLDKRYRLVESAEQLSEVILTPRTRTKSPWDFSGFLDQVGNIFGNAANQIATPPILPNNGFTTTLPSNVPQIEAPKNKGLLNWVENNPTLAGTLVLAVIAGSGYVLSKKEQKKKQVTKA